MEEPSKIRITEALRLIFSSTLPFTLDFVTKDGRKEKERRFQLSGNKMGENATGKPKKAWNHNIKESRTLLLFDLDKKEHRQIKWSRLIGFNGIEIVHFEKGAKK